MGIRVHSRWGVALAATLLAVPPALQAQGQDAALLGAEQALAELSRDSGLAAVAGTVESDGVLLWPGAPVVVGRRNARLLLEALPGVDSLQLSWQPLALELARDSSLGVTWGIVVMSNRLGPARLQIGRYIAVWTRKGSRWRHAALLFTGVEPEVSTQVPKMPLTLPPAKPTGPAGPFKAADLAFAKLAGDSGAAAAFQHWAAGDAVVFGGRGLMRRGPEAIGRGVAGPALWRWHPVAAGSASTGDLAWTVGEAVITPKDGNPSYSKYLTVWTRPNDGPIRFLTDGGNGRPRAP